MSQYPPPYPPQPPHPQGSPPPTPQDLELPARRAGVFMIAFGVLAVLFGLLLAYRANTFDPAELNSVPEARQELDQWVAMLESNGLSLRGVALTIAGLVLAVGALVGALGFGVRGGRLLPIITSIVVVALLLLLVGLATVVELVQGAATGSPLVLMSSCFYTVVLTVLVLLMIWLVQAARAQPHLAYARRQVEILTAYHQQQQQMYYQQPPRQQSPTSPTGAAPLQPPAAGGYHQYPMPPSPAPPAPQPPRSQSPASNSGDTSDGPSPQG